MPDNQALQVFYGTLPLIFVIAGAFLRGNMLLKDILSRLSRLEARVSQLEVRMEVGFGEIKERLVKLETRAGIVFQQ